MSLSIISILTTSSFIIGAALVLDFCIGEPKRYHPLIGFGNIAIWVERKLNQPNLRIGRYISGLLAWMLLILPITAGVFFSSSILLAAFAETSLFGLRLDAFFNIIIELVLLYLCIGWKSLVQHVNAIQLALQQNNITLARQRTQYIVSRDADALTEQQISQTAIESMLENGNDAIFGCLFWFLVAGAPGAVMYRLANTLDAMWGYRTPRYKQFGWAAAKLDDLLNIIPARLCALSYALLGNTRRALHCWQSQAHLLSSPNGGPVMSSGAGGLQVILGGPTYYHGKLVDKPFFGEGSKPIGNDIHRTVILVNRTVYLWFLVIFCSGLAYELAHSAIRGLYL